MHEVSLIAGLLEMVAVSAKEQGIARVTKVHLVVGAGHGALPEALSLAFAALSQGTECAGAELTVEKLSIFLRCCACHHEYSPPGWPYVSCPRCGSLTVQLLQGDELYVEYYEGE